MSPNFINITTFPEVKGSERIYYWADYLELLCLISIDGRLSISDIEEHLKREIKDDDGNIKPAVKNDNRTILIQNWFSHLQYRLTAYDNFYPFSLSEDKDTLIKKEDLSENHILYIYLLLSSCGKYIDKATHNHFTARFEWLCADALEIYLPSANVDIFGSNSYMAGEYSGNIYSKVARLANKLGVSLSPSFDEETSNSQDVGDKGLDIVAWIPFPDNMNHQLIFFGQCACGKEWGRKQQEVNPSSWQNILVFNIAPSHGIFIPFSFRNSSGKWFKDYEIQQNLIFDRLRIINLLSKKPNFSTHVPTEQIQILLATSVEI